MFKRLAVLAVLATVWTAGRLPAEGSLGIGDPAPKLEVKEFVKGDPVAKLEKGKLYVVEFWATWCGPCRTSIPHLTELQKKYKDVVFIGVSVYEKNPEGVKPFVEEMGDKMNYRVAMDLVVMNKEGKMATGWMDAAGLEGIPAAFIINKENQVAWIGHPMDMEKPLEEIVAGKYDLKAAALAAKEEKESKKKMAAIIKRLREASQSGDPKKELAVVEEAIKEEPKLEKELGIGKFLILLNVTDDTMKTLEYGRRLVEKVYHDDAEQLNNLAWPIVDPDAKKKPDDGLKKLALTASQRAGELTKLKNDQILDTLARAYFLTNDLAKALELQEKAVDMAKGKPYEDELKGRLEEYRKAKK